MKKRFTNRTVPVQDLGLNKIPTIKEQFDFFQTKGRAANLQEDEGDDDPQWQSGGARGTPDYALPADVTDLKRDYQHGEIKVYTPEEIAEYEKQRDWVEEASDD